jgi:hypothetical protein
MESVYTWLPFKRILGDAYFFSAELLDLDDRYGIQYLSNLRQHSQVKQVVEDFAEAQRQLAREAGVNVSNPKKLDRWLKTHGSLTSRTNSTSS